MGKNVLLIENIKNERICVIKEPKDRIVLLRNLVNCSIDFRSEVATVYLQNIHLS